MSVSETSVGKTIRELRNTLGLSQEEFALKLKTTQEMIAKLEGDLHKPSYKTLQKLINIFGVDPKIFFPSS
ncbi:MAG: XRE family transcriptional regulator [Candidatus Aminicenantes bacterium]|nr:MAG: XRE family transcriptional regulator [Candidatus Aminicenantes bacterium]